MTFRLLFVIAVALVVTGCVKSSSFSHDAIAGNLESGFPEGWDMGGRDIDEYEFYIDREVVHGGTAAVSIVCTDPQYRSRVRLQQQVLAAEYANRRIRFRAFVRTTHVEDYVALWLRVDSEQTRAIAFDDMNDRRIDGTTDWREYQIVLNVAESAAVVTFGVEMSGAGQLWLDDCTLEVVDSSVATTAPLSKTTPNHTAIPLDMPGAPHNMDFEGEVWELYGSGLN